MLKESAGWRDDDWLVLPAGFISLGGGGGQRRREPFPPFFDEGESIRYSPLLLSSVNHPSLHSQIQPDRVLPVGLRGARKPEPPCEITVAASPRSGCRFSSQGQDARWWGRVCPVAPEVKPPPVAVASPHPILPQH